MTSSKTCSRLDILSVQSGKKTKQKRPTLMVRRTLIGRLLKSWTNEISLSVIGRPVYIFLLREREARRQKKNKTNNNKELFRTLL